MPLASGGAAMLAWDDTEYVSQAIDTADHVGRHGLLSWPGYVMRHQVVKPPLYANVLAAGVLVFGRERATLVAAAIAGLTAMTFGLVVFLIARRLTDDGAALLVTTMLLALPAVMRWFTTAHPDGMLTIGLLAAAGLLCVSDDDWTSAHAVALGIAIGLSFWAKATVPLFLALPLLYWLVRGARSGVFQARLRALAIASAVAAVIIAPWYIPQGEGAINYARVSSGFALGSHGDSVTERAWSWLSYILPRGWGYGIALLALVGAVGIVRRRTAGGAPLHYVAIFALGAVPMLALAINSRVPPNTRHVLPALVFIAFAVSVFVAARVAASAVARVLVIAVVSLQYLVTTLSAAPPVAAALRREIGPPWGPRIAATSFENQPIALQPAQAILSRGIELARAGRPRTVYLSGNSAFVNVSRLRFLGDLQDAPVTFEWASYFTWTPSQREARRTLMRSTRCIVVLYEPSAAIALPELNVHNAELRAFVSDPDNGFEPLPDLTVTEASYSISFFMQRGAVFWKPTPVKDTTR